MAYTRRLLTNNISNAGLARLAGGVGMGVERAGRQIFNLGNAYDAQDTRDAKIRADKTQHAADIAANAKLNSLVNPKLAKEFGSDGLGLVKLSAPKEGFTLSEGQAYYDPNGKQIVKLDKSVKEPKITQKVGEDGYFYNVDSKGVFHKTDVKAKDYNKSSKKSGANVPNGYVFAGEFNIDDNLDYELAKSGAYFTDDKSGKRYVNKTKYDRLIKLGNTQIQ